MTDISKKSVSDIFPNGELFIELIERIYEQSNLIIFTIFYDFKIFSNFEIFDFLCGVLNRENDDFCQDKKSNYQDTNRNQIDH